MDVLESDTGSCIKAKNKTKSFKKYIYQFFDMRNSEQIIGLYKFYYKSLLVEIYI